MPTRAEHAAKARRNRDFLATIDVTRWPDWAATVAFYVAVHTVSQLAEDDEEFDDHGERNIFLRDHHRAIQRTYGRMKDASEKARYLSGATFAAHHPPIHVTATVIGFWLAEIEKYVAGWFAVNA